MIGGHFKRKRKKISKSLNQIIINTSSFNPVEINRKININKLIK